MTGSPGAQDARSGPVVVGVDGSGSDDAALAWAAATALAHGVPLLVLHTREDTAAEEDTPGPGERALATVTAAHPGITVDLEQGSGPASVALLGHQDTAQMLVVGSGRKGALGQLLLGTTSLTTVLHAHRPVAVVNGGVQLPAQPAGRVVVAVDGSAESSLAAEVAFGEAAARGAEVEAVVAWNVEMVGGYVVTEPDSPEWQGVQAREQRRAEATIAAARAAHPDVPVRVSVLHGPVSRTLVEHAAGCDVLVMGHRGRGGFAGKLLGSTTQKVLRTATFPVLVVRVASS